MPQKITPFLWFDSQAEEAADHYVSVFKTAPKGSAGDSKVTAVTRYSDAGANAAGRPPGSVMTVAFELDGQKFSAINGGPIFTFNESISFVVSCDTQEEIDHYWNGLIDASRGEGQCGWLKDRFGVSWQVVPSMLGELMGSNDPGKAERTMKALLEMKKLDIARLAGA
jgi:predicted 3-demethylubiquinone-9 3-methyltransferase (glyoxalase superfamily)